MGGNCSRQFPRTLLRSPPAKSVVFAGYAGGGAFGAHAGGFGGRRREAGSGTLECGDAYTCPAQ